MRADDDDLKGPRRVDNDDNLKGPRCADNDDDTYLTPISETAVANGVPASDPDCRDVTAVAVTGGVRWVCSAVPVSYTHLTLPTRR